MSLFLLPGVSTSSGELSDRIRTGGQYPCGEIQNKRNANHEEGRCRQNASYRFGAETSDGSHRSRMGTVLAGPWACSDPSAGHELAWLTDESGSLEHDSMLSLGGLRVVNPPESVPYSSGGT